ncbi:hypothetical protein GCM10009865_04520 [Aeromicrobium ponti]|uniref:Transcriptional regulator n=2 Tax=Cytobacillus oceanisediminis TaxID=665099 RepID=A0A562K662_9BACI|nr:hypothetical protein IQ19_00360 [Cytobacillus oceanisediminis]
MIKIGVITARSTIDTLKPIFKLYQDQCEYHFMSYEKLQEIKNIYKQNHKFFDGLIFGGPLPYFYLEQEIQKSSKPVVFLDISEKDFYKHLFNISQQYKELDFSRVYIDFLWGKEQALELEALLPNEKPIYTLKQEIDFKNERQYEEVLEKHFKLWREGIVDLSITRTANIVETMKKQGLNVYYLGISKDSIKEKIEELITKVEYYRIKDNQIVVGYLESPTVNNLLENELLHVSIHKELLEFCTQSGFQLGIQKYNQTFEIITSYGVLQELTNHFHYCRIIRFLKEHLSFDVNIGWGIGITVGQALKHAKMAHREAKSYMESCAFVIDENEISMGPFGFEEECETGNSFYNWKNFEKLSKEKNISVSHLQKVFTVTTRLKTTEITSNEAAEALGLSVRSANRLLNEFVEKDLAKVEQRKQNSLQGRPVKVYTIHFPPNGSA